MSYYSIQIINEHDLSESAFEANKKINYNLKQLNKNVELLPESASEAPEGDSQILYFSKVYECIKRNSQIVGYPYPVIDLNLIFSFNTKEKVYKPINDYFKTLIKP